MNNPFTKQFCIWIATPGSNDVRKFRVSLAKLGFLAIFIGATAGGLSFVVGDYSRVQLLRAKNYLWLHMVASERDRLRNSNEAIAAELETIKGANSHVLAYEQQVKERLGKLASILKSSTSLGVAKGGNDLTPNSAEPKLLAKKGEKTKLSAITKSPAKKLDGMGGPEYDCDILTGVGCAGVKGVSYNRDVGDFLGNAGVPKVDGDLVQILDSYIELLQVVPIGVPVSGNMTSGYGFRISPFHRGIKMHEGIDFGAPFGAHILSAGDGVVEEVGRSFSYGLYVDIRHNDRVVTRYAHLSRTAVTPGQRVRKGMHIANVGSSGRSTGPHLHYEVRVDGIARNPEAFLALATRLEKLLFVNS